MNLGSVLSIYIAANLLVIPALVTLWGLRQAKIPSVTELRLHYFALGLIVLLSLMLPFFPKSQIYQPTVKVWSSSSVKIVDAKSGAVDFGIGRHSAQMKTTYFSAIGWLLAMAVFGFSLSRMTADIFGLRRIIKNSFIIRKIGRVVVLSNDKILVPFSYRGLFFSYAVIPSFMLNHRRHYRIALAHEIQHHRQGDTSWIYLIWILRTVFVIHPLFYIWNRWLLEIQEFACDEALLDQGTILSREYAHCLVETAETAFNQGRPPACATGMMFLTERHLISRRIEKMLTNKDIKNRRTSGIGAMIALGLLLTSTAYASKGIVQDRRVTMTDAQAMLSHAKEQSDFPIVVNDLVLKELNRFIGTPDGREYMRNALERMETHRAVVAKAIVRYGMPSEIAAIPIIESGYKNLPESGIKGHGAGLWMFIKSTAHNYGLSDDDRLDISLETDAAMRYLSANHLRFGDWLLTIFAYNVGENAVQTGMDKLNTHDVWELIRNGLEGDHNYLARVMAAVLIMKNPDSVK